MTRFDIALGKKPPKIPFLEKGSEGDSGLAQLPLGSLVAVNPEGRVVASETHRDLPIIGVITNVHPPDVVEVHIWSQGTVLISATHQETKENDKPGFLYISDVRPEPLPRPIGTAFALRTIYGTNENRT